MKVGFVGHKGKMTEDEVVKLKDKLEGLSPSEVYHGGCIGSEQQFHDLSCKLGYKINVYPPTFKELQGDYSKGETTVLESLPFIHRNRKIVDVSDNMIVATEDKYGSLLDSSWATVRYSQQKGKEVYTL